MKDSDKKTEKALVRRVKISEFSVFSASQKVTGSASTLVRKAQMAALGRINLEGEN